MCVCVCVRERERERERGGLISTQYACYFLPQEKVCLSGKLSPTAWHNKQTEVPPHTHTHTLGFISVNCMPERNSVYLIMLNLIDWGHREVCLGKVCVCVCVYVHTIRLLVSLTTARSEECRVGKECRSRWAAYH